MPQVDPMIGRRLEGNLEVKSRREIPGDVLSSFYLAQKNTDVDAGDFAGLGGGFGGPKPADDKALWLVEIGSVPMDGLENFREVCTSLEPDLSEGTIGAPRLARQAWRASPQRGITLTDYLPDMEVKDWANLVRQIGSVFRRAHKQGFIWGAVSTEHLCLDSGSWNLRPTLQTKLSSIADSHPRSLLKNPTLTSFKNGPGLKMW